MARIQKLLLKEGARRADYELNYEDISMVDIKY